jgi:hypothetical protein
MKTLTPLRDKIIGKMIDQFGIKQTTGGLFVSEVAGSEVSVRPRWFLITHVGPDQEDVSVGDYALVDNGRWTKGIDFYGTGLNEDRIFYLDNKGIMGIADTLD